VGFPLVYRRLARLRPEVDHLPIAGRGMPNDLGPDQQSPSVAFQALYCGAMPLTEAEKNEIVETVVEILGSPDKKERLDALREQVMNREEDGSSSTADAAYAVLQAIEEIYG